MLIGSISAMILAEYAAAQIQPESGIQAISVASMSHNDQLIQGLLQFDQFALQSPNARIMMELENRRSTWQAGEPLKGVVYLEVRGA